VCDRGPEGVAALASGIDMEPEIYTVRHAEPAADHIPKFSIRL
jgi:hypothetical protein